MRKVMTLSVAKAIIFGIVINIIISSIVAIYSYDVINAFCEEPINIERGRVITVIFPGSFIIIAAVLIAYTLLSVKVKQKES